MPKITPTPRRLAEGLAKLKGISIDPDAVRTNIVFFETNDDDVAAEQLAAELAAEGVRVLPTGKKRLRAVTHYHTTVEDIDHALRVFREVLKKR